MRFDQPRKVKMKNAPTKRSNPWEKDKRKHSEWKSCTKKKRYRTEGEALHAIKMVNRTRSTKLDIYWCNWCEGYHLTSTPWRRNPLESTGTSD